VVLVHGLSRVVLSVLKAAMNTGKNFTVFVTEGRPEASGCHMAEQLLANGIPVSPFHVPVVSLRFGGSESLCIISRHPTQFGEHARNKGGYRGTETDHCSLGHAVHAGAGLSGGVRDGGRGHGADGGGGRSGERRYHQQAGQLPGNPTRKPRLHVLPGPLLGVATSKAEPRRSKIGSSSVRSGSKPTLSLPVGWRRSAALTG
jgi:hypothetical protein